MAESLQTKIAREVRRSRQERRWTQAELAERLELTQSRLSHLERGVGSFTAEQFIEILKLFNLPLAHFTDVRNEQLVLQNELARLGASHLRSSNDVIAVRGVEGLAEIVRDTLLSGSPRLITALAPVLRANIDRISLERLLIVARHDGLERRFLWLLENVQEAAQDVLNRSGAGRDLSNHRLIAVLEPFLRDRVLHGPLSFGRPDDDESPRPADVLDHDIRSAKTRARTWNEASDVSKRWGVVTALQRGDFVSALEHAHAAG
jgi:transcriptional regulator with XRE-family HTH domain